MDNVNIMMYTKSDPFSETLAGKIRNIENFNIKLITDDFKNLLSGLKQTEVHLVLFDFELSGYDKGLSQIEYIISNYNSAKVVILLEENNEKIIYTSVCKGAYDYFDKNKPITNVESKLTVVLKSGTPLAGIVSNKVKKSFEVAARAGNEFNLTDREKEILNLVVGGLTKRKIAETLSLSYHTVDSHVRNIYRKLGVQSRSQAITKVLNGNLMVPG